MTSKIVSSSLLLLALAAGCAGGDDSSTDASGSSNSAPSGGASGPPGAVGVSQAGSQDFGLFRQILEQGGLPGPETLDALGFFAEHKLDYPSPECGNSVCMHGLAGVMGNMITGAKCSLLQIGLNSPVDLASLQRPPMNLVVVVDTSGSMLGEPIEYLKQGLTRMIDELQPDDEVSLVTFSDSAKVVLEATPAPDVGSLTAAIASIKAKGATNLYDGLFTGLSLAEKHRKPGAQNRVIYLSDGEATTGILSSGKIQSLAAAYAKQGVSITSIGVGSAFDVGVMRSLGEVGAGNFYFLEDPKAVVEVFAEEVATFLYPLALDVRIDVAAGASYALRGVYGTQNWQGDERGGAIEIPSLFLAGRTKASMPIEGGRRGGGGAIIVELIPNGSAPAAETTLGSLGISWKKPDTGEEVSQVLDLTSPFTTANAPETGYFTSFTSEKGFVMLNLFMGFQMAARNARDGDPRGGRGVLEAMRPRVASWLQRNPDPDIEDDLKYVDLFMKNLVAAEKKQSTQMLPPPVPSEPWPLGD